MGELCFNFKRHRVPDPLASIPVTKCLRTRKYVPCCHNRSFFLLNVLYYCRRRILPFRLPFSHYRVRELIHRNYSRSNLQIHRLYPIYSHNRVIKMKEEKKETKIQFSLPRFCSKKVQKIRFTVAYNEQLNYDWILEGSLFARGNLPRLSRSWKTLLFLTRLSLRFLSHPSVTTASIMWEIVLGAGCWNRTMCARLSVSVTCPRRGRIYPPRCMSKHFSDTRECIFLRTFRRQGNAARERETGTLKYHHVIATSFGKSLKRLTLGKSPEFENGKSQDMEIKGDNNSDYSNSLKFMNSNNLIPNWCHR